MTSLENTLLLIVFYIIGVLAGIATEKNRSEHNESYSNWKYLFGKRSRQNHVWAQVVSTDNNGEKVLEFFSICQKCHQVSYAPVIVECRENLHMERKK